MTRSVVVAALVSACCSLVGGCSETRVTKDPAGRLRSGFRYYDPRPIAIVHRVSGTSEILNVDVQIVPDMRKPRYVAQEAGLGVAGFSVELEDGMLKLLTTEQTQAPEGFVDKVTTQYKALVEAVLAKDKAAILREEEAAKKRADASAAGGTPGGAGGGDVHLATRLDVGPTGLHLLVGRLDLATQRFRADMDARTAEGGDSAKRDPLEEQVLEILEKYRVFVTKCSVQSPATGEECPEKKKELEESISRTLLGLPVLRVYLPSIDPDPKKARADDDRKRKLAGFAERATEVLKQIRDLLPAIQAYWKEKPPVSTGKPPCSCVVTKEPDSLPETLELYDILVEGGVARLVRIDDPNFLRDLSCMYLTRPHDCLVPPGK